MKDGFERRPVEQGRRHCEPRETVPAARALVILQFGGPGRHRLTAHQTEGATEAAPSFSTNRA